MRTIKRAVTSILALTLLLLTGCAGGAPANGVLPNEQEISGGITVPRNDEGPFNRISFRYRATAPVRCTVVYRRGLKEYAEELLLSEKYGEASLLLDGFLDGKTANRLSSVSFAPLRETPCTLTVTELRCDRQTVPQAKVFLENESFRLGVKLDWGGAIGEFTDKRQSVYGNLLNEHDTGRLVQQSFYGPAEIPGYENGVFMGNVWNYNPVQGGDQFGNRSKLVAFEQSGNCIKIVSRPLDWAKENSPTFTYYTNVYTLTDAGVTVENTAIDFLETPWTPRHQELPAFYTISALGNFVFYNGDQPWTDDGLQVERDLPFWGGSESYHTVKQGNTETWCAWVDDHDYGVGVFTPIAEILLAGRHQFNGSASPMDDATNYVAPLCTFALDFGEPFSYTYYVTAGTVDEIRGTFRQLAGQ